MNKGVDGCVEEKFDEIRIGLGIKLTNSMQDAMGMAELLKDASKGPNLMILDG